MDLGSIFLILSLLVLVGMFIGRPFIEHKAVSVTHEEQAHSALLAERDRIITALQELDFDHSMGKIPSEDYPGQRAYLLQRGASVLQNLDEYLDQHAGEDSLKSSTAGLETTRAGNQPAKLRRAGNGSISAGVLTTEEAEDELEILIASRRRARQEKAAGFCPQCGGALQKSDLFCPKCGAGVKE